MAKLMRSIPISYIEDKIKEHESISTDRAFCSSLRILINLWEKENENKKSGLRKQKKSKRNFMIIDAKILLITTTIGVDRGDMKLTAKISGSSPLRAGLLRE